MCCNLTVLPQITTVGYGDLTAQTFDEIIVSIVVLIVGAVAFGECNQHPHVTVCLRCNLANSFSVAESPSEHSDYAYLDDHPRTQMQACCWGASARSWRTRAGRRSRTRSSRRSCRRWTTGCRSAASTSACGPRSGPTTPRRVAAPSPPLAGLQHCLVVCAGSRCRQERSDPPRNMRCKLSGNRYWLVKLAIVRTQVWARQSGQQAEERIFTELPYALRLEVRFQRFPPGTGQSG